MCPSSVKEDKSGQGLICGKEAQMIRRLDYWEDAVEVHCRSSGVSVLVAANWHCSTAILLRLTGLQRPLSI